MKIRINDRTCQTERKISTDPLGRRACAKVRHMSSSKTEDLRLESTYLAGGNNLLEAGVLVVSHTAGQDSLHLHLLLVYSTRTSALVRLLNECLKNRHR
jgi:hypothetical protein